MSWWMWPLIGLLAIWALELLACFVVFAVCWWQGFPE